MRNTARVVTAGVSRPARPRNPQVAHPVQDGALDIPALKASINAQLADLSEEYRSMLLGLDQTLHEAIHQTADAIDVATQNFENDEVLHARCQRIAQLEWALERIDDRHYGMCESCHRRIAPARLEALPATALCLPCKMAEEHY